MTLLPFVDRTRFTLEGKLGAGSMGVVYRAFDHQRGYPVALKSLERIGSAALYELKQEFRAFADIRHPGLLRLYELFATEEHPYFTMELVDGAPFTDVFGPASKSESRATGHRGDELDVVASVPAPGNERTLPRLIGDAQVQPLRVALRQLAEALWFLHDFGKLHRDLKPNNVLVSNEGRVVLLDFGLSQDIHGSDPGRSYEERLVAGTPAYMSPEQTAGNPASTASDWYSVGIMLYEALTGELPFSGTVEAIFSKKQTAPEPTLPGGLPEDLAGLCRQLLARSPSRRPSAAQILEALGAEPQRIAREPATAPFVGREEHLAELAHALRQAEAGAANLVFIKGKSGSGKTALARHFCDAQRSARTAQVLFGRCHPRESIPFRALDSAVDELSRVLRKPGARPGALPRHTRPLTRLFPALGRVESISQAPSVRTQPVSPSLERRLAFDAFAELLARQADLLPTILVIDDAQFGDADSAELLNWVLRARMAPAITVFILYDHHVPVSDFVAALLKQTTLNANELWLQDLTPEEAEELAEQLLKAAPGTSGSRQEAANALTLAGGAHPETLVELAADAAAELRAAPLAEGKNRPLTAISWAARSAQDRLKDLGETESRLLEFLSLAFTPLTAETLSRASATTSDACRIATQTLRNSRLLKRLTNRQEDLFQIARDPLRELVSDALAADRQTQMHSALGAALLTSGDPANAGRHFKAGKDDSSAHQCFEQALGEALASLALESALGFITEALSCTSQPQQRVALLAQRADCYERLDRPAQAAEALTQAAALSHPEEANQYLKQALVLEGHAGQIDELSTVRGQEHFNLFDSLPRGSIESIVAESEIVHGQPGDCVSRAGQTADDFLFLLSGSVELHHPSGTQHPRPPIGRVGENELVGEVGFLLEGQRQVDVVVSSPQTRILKVNREALDELALAEPRIALRLVLNLARVVCGKLLTLRQRIVPAERPDTTESPSRAAHRGQ